MKEVEKKDVPEVSGGFFPPEEIVSFPLPPLVDHPEFPHGGVGQLVPGPEPVNPADRA
jgi:hypothetical protein